MRHVKNKIMKTPSKFQHNLLAILTGILYVASSRCSLFAVRGSLMREPSWSSRTPNCRMPNRRSWGLPAELGLTAGGFLRQGCLCWLATLLLIGNADALSAQSIFLVSNTNDSGAGSLREAIESANQDTTATALNPHIIDMKMISGTITLTSGQIEISNHMRLLGPGADSLSVSGNDNLRIFEIDSSLYTEINDLTLEKGNDMLWGGAIYLSVSSGNTLILNNCKFIDNSADFGGAVGINPSISLGITLIVNNCEFINNSAGIGGAIGIQDTAGLGNILQVTDCKFINNSAVNGGGAIRFAFYNSTVMPEITINNCLFEKNQGDFGGAIQAIANFGTVSPMLTINNCQFLENQSIGNGIGILWARFEFDISLTGCWFENNSSRISILLFERSFGFIDRCVFRGNQLEGSSAIRLFDLITGGYYSITNSVISGNDGGGIFAGAMDILTVTNCTISGNSSGITLSGAPSAILANNIIYGNADSLNSNDLIGSGFSGTHNLIGTLPDSTFTDGVDGNIIGRAPCFVQPVNDFPSTEGDLRLKSGSLGIDAGDEEYVEENLDLAGDERIQGLDVDMGAYETAVPAPAISLSGNAMQITNGDLSPGPDDGTDFGAADTGDFVFRTFGIANGGTDTLVLSGMPPVQLSGNGADEFSVVSEPDIIIAPGNGTTFTISFSPSFPGTHQATINIPNNSCYDDPFTFGAGGVGLASIFGNISHWNGRPVAEAGILITGQANTGTSTNGSGDYSVSGLSPGFDYTVTPQLNTDCTDCVDVADLVRMKQHILGIRPLGNPYAMIAADLDNSGSITSLDLLQLEKLINGEAGQLSGNTCWRFVDASYLFPNPADPWMEEFPEAVNVNDLQFDTQANFTAIKIGDLAGDCFEVLPKADSIFTDFDGCVYERDTMGIPVRISSFDGYGIQFTLSWETMDLNFLGTGNYNLPGLEASDFMTSAVNSGFLTMVWCDSIPAALGPNASLFEIFFEVVGNTGSDGEIEFLEHPTPARVVSGVDLKAIELAFSDVEVWVNDEFEVGPAPDQACINDNPIPLSGLPDEGFFSGTGIVGNTFNPALAGAGLHSLSFNYFTAGCSTSVSFPIEVLPLPAIELHSNDPACEGGTLQLEETSVGAVDWIWSGPQGFSSAGQRMLILPGVTPSNNGSYQVTVTNVGGCSNSGSIEVLSINPLPLISMSSNSPVCEGRPLQLLDAANQAVLWEWQGPNNLNITTTSPQLGINPVSLADAGVYSLTVTDSNGCQNTASSPPVIVNGLPPVAVATNSPRCEGETLLLEDLIGGAVEWHWAGPGLDTVVMSPALTFGPVSPADEGVYILTATDANGCRNTAASGNVAIYPQPEVFVASNSPRCEGDSLILVQYGSLAMEWHWVGPALDTTAFDSTLIVNMVDPADGGLYNVTITDLNGCRNTASASVTVHARPPVNLLDNSPLCEGLTLQLWDTSSTVTEWHWRGPGLDTTTLVPQLSIPFATPANDGAYQVIGTDGNGCRNADNTFVSIYPKPSVAASSNSPVCEGDTLRLEGTGTGVNPVNWSWDGPGLTANGQNQQLSTAGLAAGGTYTLILRDGNHCRDTAATTAVINPLPAAALASNSPVCEGDVLRLMETSGADSLWQWAAPGLDTALQNPGLDIDGADPANSGLYSVTVTDRNGCRNTASDSVLVYARPPVAVSSNSPLCDNEGLELSEAGGAAVYWSWSGPGGFASADNNPFVERANVTPGTYAVAITDGNGCTNSATLNVGTVSGLFFESNFLTPEIIPCGDTVHLFDISEAELPDGKFLWDFGDGATSQERDPVHRYGAAGVYTVTLEVTDNECENLSLEKEVTVLDCLLRKLGLLNAYPNPSADGSITLEALLSSRSSLVIEVYSLAGVQLERRVLRDVTWVREHFTLEKSGAYFFYLLTETDRAVLKVVAARR